MSFAKIILHGNLGSDAETKYTPNGRMNVVFRMAVNEPPRENRDPEVTWYRVTAWGEQAERVDKLAAQGYITKGSGLVVEGRFKVSEWTGEAGDKRTTNEVTLTDFHFVGGRREENGDTANGNAPAREPAAIQGRPRPNQVPVNTL